MARSSWDVLRSDKKLVLFPVLSGLAVLLVLISFVGPLIALVWTGHIKIDLEQNGGQPPWWVYPLTFAFYFCNYFVIVFCNAALVSCALMRFNGQEPTLGDGGRRPRERATPSIASISNSTRSTGGAWTGSWRGPTSAASS